MSRRSRNERGAVLALVLILGMVLTTAVVAFQRRAVMDAMIVRNRDRVAEAEALARSGVEIAKIVLLEQGHRKIDVMQLQGDGVETVGNTRSDLWAAIDHYDLVTPEGATLRVSIYDNRARLNLNSLVEYGTRPHDENAPKGPDPNVTLAEGLERAKELVTEMKEHGRLPGAPDEELDSDEDPQDTSKFDEEREGKPLPDAEEFLVNFLDRVTENMDAEAAEKEDYDARELAENLLDYIDKDLVRIGGGDEDEFYQSQDPPYLAANRPLLSVQELGLVEGFDSNLVEAIEPYVTVYPLIRARGVNLNTAPSHVLGVVSHGVGGDKRLFNEDDVLQILETRDEDMFFCEKTETNPDRCITLEQADLEGPIYPPSKLPAMTFVYTVIAEARLGDVERSVEAVLDFTTVGHPRLLFWRMQ